MNYHEPWSVEPGAGYEGLISGYTIKDARGEVLFVVDSTHYIYDTSDPSAAAQAVADRIVACVNAAIYVEQEEVVEEAEIRAEQLLPRPRKET